MGKPPSIKSGYALIDITTGRAALKKHLAKTSAGVRVILHATINYPFGADDGESIEFVSTVDKIEVLP